MICGFFERTLKISLLQEKAPVKFVHRRSVDEPNSHILHLNDCVEIYIYVSGETDYIVEDRYLSLYRGDVLVISPHEIHVPILKSRSEYERFYLLFPLDLFSGFAFDPLEKFLKRPPELSPKLPLSLEQKEQFLEILYRLSELSLSKSDERNQLTAVGLLLQMLGFLSVSESEGTSVPLPEQVTGIPQILRSILKYISKKPQEIASVGDVAKHFHISAPYLSALFGKYVGVSASEYLRIRKIACAKKMLEGGSSVSDACYECGFSDSSHFIKNFKRYVGMTPNQYKNLYVKKRDERS